MTRYPFQVAPCLVLALLAACTPKLQTRVYAFDLQVERAPGEPLALVPIELDGKTLANTDAGGRAQLQLAGLEGSNLRLDVRCPPNHTQLAPLSARLVSFSQGQTPTLQATCAPNKRRVAVVVRAARGDNLPIVHHAKTIGMTDADGVAHVLLEGSPGESFDITLDTSARPDLKPQNPNAVFEIRSTDTAVAYDSEFSQKPKPRAPAPRPARRQGPQRIR